jgi:hypothetical protein
MQTRAECSHMSYIIDEISGDLVPDPDCGNPDMIVRKNFFFFPAT